MTSASKAENTPVPLVLHCGLLAKVFIVPERITTSVLQLIWSTPAATVAARLIETVFVSVATAQGPTPSGSFVVIVKSTEPVAMSLAPGVYTALKSDASLKFPSPVVVHVIELAAPPILAASRMGLFSQTLFIKPIETDGGFTQLPTIMVPVNEN